jgi:hypothetical protein
MKILQLKSGTNLLIMFLVSIFMFSCGPQNLLLETDTFSVSIDEKGQLISLKDKASNTEYLAQGQKAPLLVVHVKDSTTLAPVTMKIDEAAKLLTLTFEGGSQIGVSYEQNDTHLTLEVVSATPQDKIPGVIWGSYPTTISETIGEVIGVVRNKDFAIGLQSLNIKTTGGFPRNNVGSIPNRKGAADKTDYGSALHAFTFDRSFERTADVWADHFKNMPVIPIAGETVVGSKIALFGCPADDALVTMGEIELAEGLPHPLVKGEWIKTHPERSKAYMITNFTEENFDELLDYTKKAGMNAIYHAHPFINWGAFDLIPEQFPNGIDGMKGLVDKAADQGVRVGVHTLTTFTTPNDPFITPVPNENLSMTGSGLLTADMDEEATEISVSTSEFFDNEKFNWMHTVKIENELIRYRSVTKEAPYKLVDCERGAFGTTVSNHKKGEEVGKLLDHPYKVFFPNFELQKEMAQNMVDFFNATGVSQMDFDGHEGALGTGQGTYSMDDFAKRVFEGTNHNLVNGSSRITHYYWHINHYENWGEPWYGGFRQSQSEYRFNNQPFLEANYLPNMLGWFSVKPNTTVEDIEWMLARGAGYNAGFALSARIEALKENQHADEILGLIRIWEKARLSGAFDMEKREQLKDLSKEFHLEEVSDTEWKLMMFQDHDFSFEKTEVQPGQPTYAEWKFSNETGEQPFRTIISLEGEGTVSNITFEVSNYAVITIPEKLNSGQVLNIARTGILTITDAKGNVIKERMVKNLPTVGDGSHAIQFDCKVEKGSPTIKVKVRLDGKEETVKAKR